MEHSEETQELIEQIDEFAKRMKERLIEKDKNGYAGWNTCSLEHARYRITEASKELVFNPQKDVDVANLCLIHFVNRKK